MIMLNIWVPGIPVPQGSKRAYNGRVVDSNQATLRPWRDTITTTAADALAQHPGDWPATAPMNVGCRFQFPRLAAHHTKRGTVRDNAPYYKPTRPDIDKLLRAVLDALTAAAIWADDAQVVTVQAGKVYDGNPGLQLHITPIRSHP